MMTFEDYKARISIIQIAEDLGYKQDKSKGANNPVYKLTDTAGNKIDEIVIRNPHNNSQQHYFDRNHRGGDVIAFVKNHINDFPQFQHNNLFVRLNMVLSNYANTPYSPKYESYNSNVKQNNEFNISRYNVRDASIEDLKFLTKERGISHDTVSTFLPFIKMVNDTQAKGNYYNVGFPYINPTTKETSINNFELRNFGFKGMAAGGDKSSSLWLADFSSDKALVKNVYLFESAIDGLSFYQLNKDKIDLERSVFGSVGGYISDNQIKNTLKAYPNAIINTGFDNDLNGNIYDIKVHSIMANLNLKIEAQKDKSIVNFTTEKHRFALNNQDVSITRFRDETHSSARMKVFKPKEGKDFNEILLQKQKSKSLKI